MRGTGSVLKRLGTLALALAALLLLDADAWARPNIVVVITDDEPALDGRLTNFMPTVRRLRDQGVTFSEFHATTPRCCPSRASYLTGLWARHHGVIENQMGPFQPDVTLATALHEAGYHTILAGKYLNGYGQCERPFCAPTVSPGWDRWAALGNGTYYGYDVYVDGAGPEAYGHDPADYSTDVLARLADRMIREAPPDQPVFAWLAPVAPHSPNAVALRHEDAFCPVGVWQPPSWNEEDVSDKPLYVRERPLRLHPPVPIGRCRSLLAVDDLVARVLEALAVTRRADETLIVYVSDNGMNLGEHRLSDKSAPYQTQVPAFMWWPSGLGDAPRTISVPVANIDLAPTLCELAGCVLGPYPTGQAEPDGVSLVPLLIGGAATLEREEILTELPQGVDPIPAWEAITTTRENPRAYSHCALAGSGGCRWHYIEYETGESELYDIAGGPCWTWTPGLLGDPCELQNLASRAEYATVVEALSAKLDELRATSPTNSRYRRLER